MTESEQVYEQIAREAIEHALGRTFENPEAVPRRDAFIRDATDLLARFVAARCGNPGFHSARFFDAVIALSNARARIRDAARRSRVVERLVEAERRVRSLETALSDRNEQLVQAASGDVATLARALSDADARIRTLERELSELRNAIAAGPVAGAGEEITLGAPGGYGPEGRSGTPDGRGATVSLARLDADLLEAPRDPEAPPHPTPSEALEPERRLSHLRAERDELREAATRLESEKQQVELERDALQAQIEQLQAREAPLREVRVSVGRERDELLLRLGEETRERERVTSELTRERERLVAELEADRARAVQIVERERDQARRGLAETQRERDDLVRARAEQDEARLKVEATLVAASKQLEEVRAAVAAREAERQQAEAETLRAVARAGEAEVLAAREAQAAARSRRERDELRVERDRLRAEREPLEATRRDHGALLEALGAGTELPLEGVLTAIARRHEVVLCHEPPAFDAAIARLERARTAGGAAGAEAARRLERARTHRERYPLLVARLQDGKGAGAEAVELARLLAAHEEDVRLLDGWLERG